MCDRNADQACYDLEFLLDNSICSDVQGHSSDIIPNQIICVLGSVYHGVKCRRTSATTVPGTPGRRCCRPWLRRIAWSPSTSFWRHRQVTHTAAVQNTSLVAC